MIVSTQAHTLSEKLESVDSAVAGVARGLMWVYATLFRFHSGPTSLVSAAEELSLRGQMLDVEQRA